MTYARNARNTGACATCHRHTTRAPWLFLVTSGCRRCATIAWQRERAELELDDDGRWTVPMLRPEKKHLVRVRRRSRDTPTNAHLAAIYAEPLAVAAARCEEEYR